MGYERYSGRPSYYRDRDQDRYRDRDDQRARGYEGRGRPPSDYDYDDRGFFDRAGDEVRSWFGDEEAERRRRWDERLQQREYERRYGRDDNRGRSAGGFAGDYSGGYGGGYDPAYYGGLETPGYGASYGAGRGAGATSSWGLGAGPDHDGWGRDPNYNSWRQRHVGELDRDYDEYRRENQSRFDSEFATWRSNRQTQRESLRQAKEHQEVVGSDGQHVGTVDHVRGDRILLTKADKDASGHHHSIPCSWITKVGDKVEINRTAAQAQQAWRDEEDQNTGPRNLNRAFSGTY